MSESSMMIMEGANLGSRAGRAVVRLWIFLRWTMRTRIMLMCILALVGNLQTTELQAQSTWEVTPYETRVWLEIGDQPDLPDAWQADFTKQLLRKLQGIFRATWRTSVAPAPKEISFAMQGDLSVTAEQVFAVDPTLAQMDKLFLVVVDGQRSGYRVRIRELDCRLAYLGPIDEHIIDVLPNVADRTAQLIATAFSPVVRIDRTLDGKAKTRLRAGSLIQRDTDPGTLHPGDVLLPYDRRVSNTGQAKLKDIRPIDWTYLLVGDKAAVGNIRYLDIVSGYRQPFRSKRSRRLQQLAIRARPAYEKSVIRLRSRAKTAEALIGYEIHEKGTKVTSFLGYTDWQGEISIPANGQPIRTLLVRSGGRVTAKLPIVPGLRREIVAPMLDNRQRVETDGFISGLQTALIDLVARRESLSVRIQRRIREDDVPTATQLLEQFRDLPTQSDFRRQIQQYQQSLNVTDPSLRKRIDTMFIDTIRTLGKYLDAGQLRRLETELAAARAA